MDQIMPDLSQLRHDAWTRAVRTGGWGGAQCYQMELRWRFRDLSGMFQKWKKMFQHVVCIHIEQIWFKNQQVSTWTKQVTTLPQFLQEMATSFTSKKDMEKLS